MVLNSDLNVGEDEMKEVIALAERAGILVWRRAEFHNNSFVHVDDGMDGDLTGLVQLCRLVRAEERQRAARICASLVDVQYPAMELAERILDSK